SGCATWALVTTMPRSLSRSIKNPEPLPIPAAIVADFSRRKKLEVGVEVAGVDERLEIPEGFGAGRRRHLASDAGADGPRLGDCGRSEPAHRRDGGQPGKWSDHRHGFPPRGIAHRRPPSFTDEAARR